MSKKKNKLTIALLYEETAKSKTKAEYGEFQTPPGLAQQVCALLARRGLQPSAVLEPTCGFGSLLFAALDEFVPEKAVGADINATYIKWAQAALAQRKQPGHVTLTTADFFATDWQAVIASLPDPVLVLGNPPWVTTPRSRFIIRSSSGMRRDRSRPSYCAASTCACWRGNSDRSRLSRIFSQRRRRTNMSGGGRPMQSSWHSFPTRNGSIANPSSLILAVTEPDAPLSNNRRLPN